MSPFILSFESNDPQTGRATARIRLHPNFISKTVGLTPICTGPSELESAIKHLKAELDLLSKEARSKFRTHWRSVGNES